MRAFLETSDQGSFYLLKCYSKFLRYIEALEDLEIARYSEDEKIFALVEQFERFSHTDLLEEIKSLKVTTVICLLSICFSNLVQMYEIIW